MKHDTLSPLAFTLCALVAFTAAPAWAQDSDDDDDDTIELEPDGLDDVNIDPESDRENPDLLPDFDAKPPKKTEPTADLEPDYPREVVARPLILHAGMTQVTFDTLSNVDDFFVTSLLEARHSVNPRVQIGLGYNPGAVDGDGFTPGKAFSVEARYLITDWLVAQAKIPVFVDPFSLGVTVGAPMKFRFGDKLAFILGQDLISVKLVRFVAAVEDPLFNDGQVAADDVNTTLDAGELRFLGGVIYQYSPELAITAESGILAKDFSNTDAGVPLLATLTYASSSKLDLGARVGFRNLDDATGTFGATILVAVRL